MSKEDDDSSWRDRLGIDFKIELSDSDIEDDQNKSPRSVKNSHDKLTKWDSAELFYLFLHSVCILGKAYVAGKWRHLFIGDYIM